MHKATVTERTQEIGIRRALGARQKDITVQFLVEALILCLIGGSIGVLGGCGFAAFRHNILHTTTIITEWSVIIAFGLSVAVGLIFGQQSRQPHSTQLKHCAILNFY